MAKARHVPDGWPALIPRLFAAEPERLVRFLQDVFGAVGTFRSDRPSCASRTRC
jgi:hypothetical protein